MTGASENILARDGVMCLGCEHRNVSHGYDADRKQSGSGIGMGACGRDGCDCIAFEMPAKLRADELLPGDVMVGSGWTVQEVWQRISARESARMVHVVWAEGVKENWAPSILAPAEAHHVERDGRPAQGLCRARFGANDNQRCVKHAGHEPLTHSNARYLWGDALVVPEASDDLVGEATETTAERLTGGLLDLLEDVTA